MGPIGKWLAAAVMAMLTACNPMAELEDADRAVALFHRQLDSGSFDAIWQASDEEFRGGQPKGEYDAFLKAVRDKLGAFERTERQGFNVATNTGGTFVTVDMLSEFERGAAAETFVFRRSGDDLKLLNYNVNSRALIVN